jgi:hypothetical protein
LCMIGRVPICVCKDSAFIPLRQGFFCIFLFCGHKRLADADFAVSVIENPLAFSQFRVSLCRRGGG